MMQAVSDDGFAGELGSQISIVSCLERIFASAGYTSSEAYEDGLGGLVVDFIRSEDRVTLAIDEDGVQLLYDDTFEAKIQAAVAQALEEVGLQTIKRGPFFGLGESNWKRNYVGVE